MQPHEALLEDRDGQQNAVVIAIFFAFARMIVQQLLKRWFL